MRKETIIELDRLIEVYESKKQNYVSTNGSKLIEDGDRYYRLEGISEGLRCAKELINKEGEIMDVKEARKLKNLLEKTIKDSVEQFTRDTGLGISGINLNQIDLRPIEGNGADATYIVAIDTEL